MGIRFILYELMQVYKQVDFPYSLDSIKQAASLIVYEYTLLRYLANE